MSISWRPVFVTLAILYFQTANSFISKYRYHSPLNAHASLKRKTVIKENQVSEVEARLYDISSGLSPLCSVLLNKKIDAIWHVGIAAFGKEYWLSTHVEEENLSNIEYALGLAPKEVFKFGTTSISQEEFETFLYDTLAVQYNKDSYDVFKHNCNHFADDMLYFLTEKRLPSFINELFENALSNQGKFKAGITYNVTNQVAKLVMIAWERANAGKREYTDKRWQDRTIKELESLAGELKDKQAV